jgi:hypothetical protein
MYIGVLSMILGQAWVYRSASVALYGCVVVAAFYLFVVFYEEPTLSASVWQPIRGLLPQSTALACSLHAHMTG